MTTVDSAVRTRIGLLVNDADYRSAAGAVDDAWRVALLALVPGAQEERERVRRDAVFRANAARDPRARPPRTAGTLHRGLFIATIVVAALSIALIAPSPRNGHIVLTLQEGALASGVIALVAALMFRWLEPLRASGDLWGSHAPAAIHLVFAVLWIALVASALVFRLREIDPSAALVPVVGLVLLVACAVSEAVLWRRGRRTDIAGAQAGTSRVTRGLIADADAAAVFDALDGWWADAGRAAEASDPTGLAEARRSVLAQLRDTGLIDPGDERRAAASSTPPPWKERRR